MEKKFIVVTDKPTAEFLFGAGFILVSRSGGVFAFINDPPSNFNFASVDMEKISYSNILNV